MAPSDEHAPIDRIVCTARFVMFFQQWGGIDAALYIGSCYLMQKSSDRIFAKDKPGRVFIHQIYNAANTDIRSRWLLTTRNLVVTPDSLPAVLVLKLEIRQNWRCLWHAWVSSWMIEALGFETPRTWCIWPLKIAWLGNLGLSDLIVILPIRTWKMHSR